MPLTIYRRGSVWHFRGTIKGRLLRGSCETADKTIAARVAADVERRYWQRRLDGPESVVTFAEAALLYREAEKSTRFLEAVEDYWKDALMRDIKPGAIRQAAIRVFPAAKPATRNRQFIVPTVAIINHAAKLGLCAPLTVERFKVDSEIKKPVTEEWLQAFCAAGNAHIGALAMFMYGTGARVSEALAVRDEDLNLAAAEVLIRQTKIGAERIAHLPSPVVVALANLPKAEGRGVFFYMTREGALHAWDGAIKKAGIEPLTFHCCRHGFATSLLQRGVDVKTVAVKGGWKSAALVLSTYGHAAERKDVTDVLFNTPQTQPGRYSARKAIKWGTS